MTSVAQLRQILAVRWRAELSGPYFKLEPPPQSIRGALPSDYVDVIQEFGGKEGFLGTQYLHLYQFDELLDFNNSYDAPALFPEGHIFGSNGCGEAFAFRLSDGAIVRIPFIPLIAEFADSVASSFTDLVTQFSSTGDSAASNPATRGMEVHDKHPIVLGGSPTDPSNKVLVPVVKHAEICKFWNQAYRQIRSQHEMKR